MPRRDGAREMPPRCGHCEDVLGMYEPIMLIADGAFPRLTSRAAEPLPAGALAMHLECYRRDGHR